MNRINSKLTTLALASVVSLGFASIASAQAPATPNSATKTDMDSDQPVTDTWITTKVKSTLATTKGVESMDISVDTVEGVVTLTGVQPNEIAVKKAIAAAKSIKGVSKVDSSGLKVK